MEAGKGDVISMSATHRWAVKHFSGVSLIVLHAPTQTSRNPSAETDK